MLLLKRLPILGFRGSKLNFIVVAFFLSEILPKSIIAPVLWPILGIIGAFWFQRLKIKFYFGAFIHRLVSEL
jgi:hypothetical protein